MKFWILDADVIIDLLSMGIFNSLCKNHKIYAATTVIDEVRHFKENGCNKSIDFRKDYVEKDLSSQIHLFSLLLG